MYIYISADQQDRQLSVAPKRASENGYTRSPSQDSPSQDFRQGLGCSGTHLFIGSG